MKSIQLLQMLEEINYGRRDVLGAIAMSLATVGLGMLVSTGTPSSDTAPDRRNSDWAEGIFAVRRGRLL